ncbi:DUF1229 domain-containing protein [Leptospira noguchii]|uniref:PF06797 family protein n=1 Tax=Leptospira noguchii TaxID=28182 RepID=M6VKN5_9LEPT|nr:DUF1229 domain-containing protein [Leptospira noguchii]EMO53654.1 PF06797 family protein [Leptospira noguchii]
MVNFIFRFRILSLPAVCWVCSILIGFGTIYGRLSLFTIGLSLMISLLLLKQAKWNMYSILSLLLIVSFLLAYFFFYKIPVMPSSLDGKLNPIIYVFKAFPVLLSFLIISILPNLKQKELFFIGIALGMFVFAIINSIATLIYLEPPYYGKAFHFFYKIKYNSPGITILVSMLPIILFCFSGYIVEIKKKLNPKLFFFVGVLGISTSISALFSARSFFFILMANVISFFVIRMYKNFLKSDRSIYYKIGICLVAIIVLLIGFYFFIERTYIGERIRYGVYSEKIKHHVDYWNTVKDNFFVYPEISFKENNTFWYHNVFFDSHKTSGPITALILYIYSFFIFIIALKNSLKRDLRSFRYFHFYICFIPYLMTTIPWESSESQMMALFTGLGALITTVNDQTPEI